MISIVIPLYNKEKYIKATILNVLSQSFSDFELIVINDGSTDRSSEIVKSIKDSRIKFYERENAGVSSARNYGVKKSTYDYIAFLDADDIWLPNHLEELTSLINEYGDKAKVFTVNFARKYDQNTIIPNRTYNDLDRGIILNYFRQVMRRDVVNSSCICIEKEAFVSVKGFDCRFTNGEDLDLWRRLAKKYRFAYSPILTVYYQMNAENNSSGKISRIKTSDNYINLSESESFYEFLYLLERKIKFKIKLLLNRYY